MSLSVVAYGEWESLESLEKGGVSGIHNGFIKIYWGKGGDLIREVWVKDLVCVIS